MFFIICHTPTNEHFVFECDTHPYHVGDLVGVSEGGTLVRIPRNEYRVVFGGASREFVGRLFDQLMEGA